MEKQDLKHILKEGIKDEPKEEINTINGRKIKIINCRGVIR